METADAVLRAIAMIGGFLLIAGGAFGAISTLVDGEDGAATVVALIVAAFGAVCVIVGGSY